jgi:VCBS repeat-containing protein
MEALIGTVRKLDGTFFLRTPEGETKRLNEGDEVHSGDYIYGEGDNTFDHHIFVKLADVEGEVLLVENEGRRFNEALVREFLEQQARNEYGDSIDDIETAAGDIGEEVALADSSESPDVQFAQVNDRTVDVNAQPAGEGATAVAGGTIVDSTGIPTMMINTDPTALAATTAIGEGNGVLHGYLPASDIDGNDVLTYSLPEGYAVPYGFALESDGNWSFDSRVPEYDILAVGENVVWDIPVIVTDSAGGTTTTSIKIGVYGTNDTPEMTVETDGTVITSGVLSNGGDITINDVDQSDVTSFDSVYNDDIQWSGGTLTAAQIAALTDGFTAGDTRWDYSVDSADTAFLGDGETVTFSYNFSASDAYDSDTQSVTITLTGTGGVPDLDADVAPVIEPSPFELLSATDASDGYDTLALSEPYVDLGSIADQYRSIEEVRYETDGQTVKLELDDVVKMTDGDNMMRFTSDGEGTLQLSLSDSAEADTEWQSTGTTVTEENGHVYDVYTSLDQSVTLQVDQQLTVEDF